MKLKELVQFIRTKMTSFFTKNTSVEDRYMQAANNVIDEMLRLKTAKEKSVGEESRLRKLAEEKTKQAIQKENEIRRINKDGSGPVVTHAKLAILFRRTATALIEKADGLANMRTEIAKAVVSLDDQRQDLAVKLEYIRETKAANDLGISCAADVVELAALTKVNVEDVMMRIETFNGHQQTEVTDYEVEELIASLK